MFYPLMLLSFCRELLLVNTRALIFKALERLILKFLDTDMKTKLA